MNAKQLAGDGWADPIAIRAVLVDTVKQPGMSHSNREPNVSEVAKSIIETLCREWNVDGEITTRLGIVAAEIAAWAKFDAGEPPAIQGS